jgi:hypothetical protein
MVWLRDAKLRPGRPGRNEERRLFFDDGSRFLCALSVEGHPPVF